MILVVCALPAELRYFEAPEHVEVIASGVGPVEAAHVVGRALALRTYDCVVNAGIAGAFPGRARVGDARLVVADTLADLGLEGGGALDLPDGATLAQTATADADLVARCGGVLPHARGLTVSQVTATRATGERLFARYGADVESMEGFSILRACTVAGVPALEVRGISNYVGERSESAWNFGSGARAVAAALRSVLDRLPESPPRAGQPPPHPGQPPRAGQPPHPGQPPHAGQSCSRAGQSSSRAGQPPPRAEPA